MGWIEQMWSPLISTLPGSESTWAWPVAAMVYTLATFYAFIPHLSMAKAASHTIYDRLFVESYFPAFESEKNSIFWRKVGL